MNKKELFKVPLLLHFICLSEVKKKKKGKPIHTHTSAKDAPVRPQL